MGVAPADLVGAALATIRRVPRWVWILAGVALAQLVADTPWRWLLLLVLIPVWIVVIVRLARIAWQTPRAFLDGLHGR